MLGGPRCGESTEVNRKLYLTCLWPGLPELWWRGRLAALPTAIAFAVAVNLLLVARFIYPEWLAVGLVRMAGWVGLAFWGCLVLKATQQLPVLLNPRAASGQPDRFADAHLAYLRGEWGEAEALLVECLALENRDPPALLLLAGVYRHSRRWEAAERVLDEIRLTEAADRWWLEIETEAKRLARDRQQGRTTPGLDSELAPVLAPGGNQEQDQDEDRQVSGFADSHPGRHAEPLSPVGVDQAMLVVSPSRAA